MLPLRVLLLLLPFLFQPVGLLADRSAALPPIKVGVIAALSGDYASWGETARNAATMALEKVDPEVKEKFQLVFEDDQGQPKNSVAAFTKLTTADGVKIVITVSSPPSNAVSPLVEARGLLQIAIAADPKISRGRRHVTHYTRIIQ